MSMLNQPQARLKAQQAAAREALGANHIGSPQYRFNPRHSNDPAIYPHFRGPMLREIAARAEEDRSGNPAHLRHLARLYNLTRGA